MLNCLSTFPVSEMSQENMNLLMTLMYTHLEGIPNLDKPQNMVIVHCAYYLTSEFTDARPAYRISLYLYVYHIYVIGTCLSAVVTYGFLKVL